MLLQLDKRENGNNKRTKEERRRSEVANGQGNNPNIRGTITGSGKEIDPGKDMQNMFNQWNKS